ncbi:hypothetical protein [Bradyrhizobium sp. ORS 285]|nr:hypothetical protein [Bradyrhizobium sp. ORS 285]
MSFFAGGEYREASAGGFLSRQGAGIDLARAKADLAGSSPSQPR